MADKEVIITFDTLFDLARRERYRAELQGMDKGFFTDVVTYLNDKQSILKSQENKDSIFSSTEAEKTRMQLLNAKKILRELYERREAKILQMALFHSRNPDKPVDSSSLLSEEVMLCEDIEKLLMNYRKNVLHRLLEHKAPEIAKSAEKPKALKIEESKEQQDTMTVCLKCNVPEFVGPDLKPYGPFNAGDKAELPCEICSMLVQNGHAIKEGKDESS